MLPERWLHSPAARSARSDSNDRITGCRAAAACRRPRPARPCACRQRRRRPGPPSPRCGSCCAARARPTATKSATCSCPWPRRRRRAPGSSTATRRRRSGNATSGSDCCCRCCLTNGWNGSATCPGCGSCCSRCLTRKTKKRTRTAAAALTTRTTTATAAGRPGRPCARRCGCGSGCAAFRCRRRRRVPPARHAPGCGTGSGNAPSGGAEGPPAGCLSGPGRATPACPLPLPLLLLLLLRRLCPPSRPWRRALGPRAPACPCRRRRARHAAAPPPPRRRRHAPGGEGSSPAGTCAHTQHTPNRHQGTHVSGKQQPEEMRQGNRSPHAPVVLLVGAPAAARTGPSPPLGEPQPAAQRPAAALPPVVAVATPGAVPRLPPVARPPLPLPVTRTAAVPATGGVWGGGAPRLPLGPQLRRPLRAHNVHTQLAS